MAERSENTGKICSSGTECTDSVTRTTTWTGKVGLMYPSDYGYATGGGSGTYNRSWCLSYPLSGFSSWSSSTLKSNCAEKSWLYNSSIDQWTLTPEISTSRSNTVVYVSTSGGLGDTSAKAAWGVRPVVYLNSKAVIKSGDGTQGSPYVFEVRGS